MNRLQGRQVWVPLNARGRVPFYKVSLDGIPNMGAPLNGIPIFLEEERGHQSCNAISDDGPFTLKSEGAVGFTFYSVPSMAMKKEVDCLVINPIAANVAEQVVPLNMKAYRVLRDQMGDDGTDHRPFTDDLDVLVQGMGLFVDLTLGDEGPPESPGAWPVVLWSACDVLPSVSPPDQHAWLKTLQAWIAKHDGYFQSWAGELERTLADIQVWPRKIPDGGDEPIYVLGCDTKPQVGQSSSSALSWIGSLGQSVRIGLEPGNRTLMMGIVDGEGYPLCREGLRYYKPFMV